MSLSRRGLLRAVAPLLALAPFARLGVLPAMAQSQTFVVLNTHRYSTVQQGQTTMPAGVSQVTVTLVVTTAFQSPQAVELDVDWSADGGATWQPVDGRVFTAPLVNRAGQTILQDGMTFNDPPPAGSLIRGTATPYSSWSNQTLTGTVGAATFGIQVTVS